MDTTHARAAAFYPAMTVAPLAGGFTPVHGNLNVALAAIWIGIVIVLVTLWTREDRLPRWAEALWRIPNQRPRNPQAAPPLRLHREPMTDD
ncbi:MAG: hypothetical protein ACRD01_08435 [Terriglobales bacterium]